MKNFRPICTTLFNLNFRRIIEKMSYLCTLIIAIHLLAPISSANAATLRGFVLNKTDEAPLPNANIVVLNTAAGTITRQDGSFELARLAAGAATLQVSHIGFATQQVMINVKQDEIASVTILLQPQPVVVDEIYLTSTRYRRTWQDLSMPLASV
ncbi:carboxypeptidase-like regulatory domain-containing protein, partial [candidate division KSB1 bacterium]